MDNWVLRKTETDIIDEKGSMEEQSLKSALGRKRAACSEDFFIYMLVVVHMCTAHYRILIVCCSQRIWPAQFCTKRFFRGRSLWLPPTGRPSAQSLVRRGRKIELICKAKLCGKTLTTGNQLIQASSAAFIVGLFSTNRKWDGTNIFFTCQLTISMLG